MKFSDFIGNTAVRNALESAVCGNRISNAYLLTGPAQVGKRTLALVCAKALLCSAFEGESCGDCDSCRRFEAEGEIGLLHPDLHIVEPQGNFIRVDQVRKDLVTATQLRPHSGGRQVFIVDPAEAMNPSAANAFLKTLEEAPGGAVFFLISVKPSALLPTVLSRCQRYNLQPVNREELAAALEQRRDLNKAEALTVADLSRGAVGRALEFNLEAYHSERKIALEFVVSALGGGGIDGLFSVARKLHAERDRFEQRIDEISTLIRDIMLLASAGSSVTIVHEDIKPELLELARGRSPRKLAILLSALAEMREPLVRNVRVDTICERVMFEGRELLSPGRSI